MELIICMIPFYNVIPSFPKPSAFLGKMITDILSTAEGTARGRDAGICLSLEGSPGTRAACLRFKQSTISLQVQ